jgi:hypothetical protein
VELKAAGEHSAAAMMRMNVGTPNRAGFFLADFTWNLLAIIFMEAAQMEHVGGPLMIATEA